jgi:hypothetical protein
MQFPALLFPSRAMGIERIGLEQPMLRRSITVWTINGRGGNRIDGANASRYNQASGT